MFQAILNGKVRNNLPGIQTGTEWRNMYRKTEDFLTASVFTRLTYLPHRVLWALLRRAMVVGDILIDQQLPENVGELKARDFWPRWTLNGQESGTQRKEPDVCLEFDQLYLVVEAKADDGYFQQYSEQWAWEIVSFLQREDIDGSIPLWLLAIGGLGAEPARSVVEEMRRKAEGLLHQKYNFPDHQISVAVCSWRQLLIALLEEAKCVDDNAISRVLADILEILRFHGFRDVHWLSDLTAPQVRTLLPIRDTSIKILEQWCGDLKRPPWYLSSNLFGIREQSALTLGRKVMASKQEIDTALQDVRKAYRLIYLYQRRVLDLCNEIVRGFESELNFYRWSSSLFRYTPGGGINPTSGHWAWNFSPLYDFCVFYLPMPRNVDYENHQPGDWTYRSLIFT